MSNILVIITIIEIIHSLINFKLINHDQMFCAYLCILKIVIRIIYGSVGKKNLTNDSGQFFNFYILKQRIMLIELLVL